MVIQFLLFAIFLIVVAYISYRLGKTTDGCGDDKKPGNCTEAFSKVRSSKDSTLERDLILLKNYRLEDAITFFKRNEIKIPALKRLLNLYKVERKFPDLSYFRLGPNMFEHIVLDWIIIHDPKEGELVAHGITTKFFWNQDIATLPEGWQGVVRQSYVHSNVEIKKSNTLVGLFIFVEDAFRKQGWANNVIEEMRALAQEKELEALIIPLRPPTRFKKEYADIPMDEFAMLKREDGHPMDHWIRLHTRLGAKILKASERSHRHVMSFKDFRDLFSDAQLPDSGETLVERNGEWYTVYADLKRDFVLVTQGCVWVRHQF